MMSEGGISFGNGNCEEFQMLLNLLVMLTIISGNCDLVILLLSISVGSNSFIISISGV